MQHRSLVILLLIVFSTTPAMSRRLMENLDRGIVARRSGSAVFVSWRLFGTDPAEIGFNLYRQRSGGDPVLVCTTGPDEGTNYMDEEGNEGDVYFVRTLLNDTEGEPSRPHTYNGREYLSIPLESHDGSIHFAWAGDLDGDGDMDFVVDRLGRSTISVDAYTNDGTFLWRMDMGPNSDDRDNIEGGPSVISNGHNDGLTVYDFDSDGKAEVAIKTANGVTFGDGAVLNHNNDRDQFLSVVDGMTGKELARTQLPSDFISDGPLQAHFGVGYFDGVHPSIVTRCKNRQGSGGFNLVANAWDFRDGELTERWQWIRGGQRNTADFHQHRIVDVDGDGRDEFSDGGYVLDEDGSFLYGLDGVVHGDRFHITDLDPSRPGLEGYGIQQDNPSGLETYYYDAADGTMIRRHSGGGGDLARGTVLDLYENEPGYEYMSFNGMVVAQTGKSLTTSGDAVPWPNFRMWWDGDLGSEHMDHNWVGKWDIQRMERNTYTWKVTFDGLETDRGAIPLYGDLFGDWREEAVVESSNHSELRIYTTNYPTEHRIYTLLHNPAYRNCLTVKGYLQSHHVDYFLGFGMDTPPAPDIVVSGTTAIKKTVRHGTAPSMTDGGAIKIVAGGSHAMARDFAGMSVYNLQGKRLKNIDVPENGRRLTGPSGAAGGIYLVKPMTDR